MDLNALLEISVQNKSSDLHVSAGCPPRIRVDGDLIKLDMPELDHESILHNIYGIMDKRQQAEFERDLEMDFSFEIPELGRFRVNAFHQLRGASAVFRTIPSTIPSLEGLQMPAIIEEITQYHSGLVLVTGPTGSGKSTTLAAMIDSINASRHDHIITIEDPVEFVHQSKKCLINQREVYKNTLNFNAALRSVLREDPDVILVGELRDAKTIRLALTAAETGHLVFGTLHTHSANSTINRIIDMVPAVEATMVRSMLSESLKAVITQRLIKKNGGGRIAALEIMIGTPAIRNLIRENKIAQMYSCIQTGRAKGMQTLDQNLLELVNRGVITQSHAGEVATDKALFFV